MFIDTYFVCLCPKILRLPQSDVVRDVGGTAQKYVHIIWSILQFEPFSKLEKVDCFFSNKTSF